MVTGLQELGLKRFHFVESTGYDTWEIRGFNDINERLGVEIGEPQRRPKHLRDGYAVNWAKVPTAWCSSAFRTTRRWASPIPGFWTLPNGRLTPCA